MEITDNDIFFVQGVARDAGIHIDEAQTCECITKILVNDNRDNTNYEDFYYSCRQFFLN